MNWEKSDCRKALSYYERWIPKLYAVRECSVVFSELLKNMLEYSNKIQRQLDSLKG